MYKRIYENTVYNLVYLILNVLCDIIRTTLKYKDTVANVIIMPVIHLRINNTHRTFIAFHQL